MILRLAGSAFILLLCSCASGPGRISADASFVRERFRFTCDPIDFKPLYLRQDGQRRVLYWGNRRVPLANCKQPCVFVGTLKPVGLAVWYHDHDEKGMLRSTEGWGAGPFSSHGSRFWSGESGTATLLPDPEKPERWRLALNGSAFSATFENIWAAAVGRMSVAFQVSTPDHEHFVHWGDKRFGPFDFVEALSFDDRDRLFFLADECVYRNGVEVIAEGVDKAFLAGDRLLTRRDRTIYLNGKEVMQVQGGEAVRHVALNGAGVLVLIQHRDRTFEVRGPTGTMAVFDDVHWYPEQPSAAAIYVGSRGGLDHVWTGESLQGPFELVGTPAFNVRGAEAGVPVLRDGVVDVLRVGLR